MLHSNLFATMNKACAQKKREECLEIAGIEITWTPRAVQKISFKRRVAHNGTYDISKEIRFETDNFGRTHRMMGERNREQ